MPPRFFSRTSLPRANFPQTLMLDAEAAQHVRVLRLEIGDVIALFDNDFAQPEGELHGAILAIDKKSVSVEVTAWHPRSAESAARVTLIQSLAVGDKMDLIVQKAVELSVAEVVPLRAARATLKLDGERAVKRVAHWNAVAIAACEQCGRNRVPPVRQVQSLDEALADVMARGHRVALMHPSGGQTLTGWAAHSPDAPLALLVGPEGGFTEQEIAQALAAGATQVTFGPRVLRTETAGLAALAAIQAVLGDLR